MILEDIIKTFREYYKEFPVKERIGLINPEFPDTFTPSVGAVHLDRILKDEKQYKKTTKYSIADVCYRDFDANLVDRDRLSLFEMCAAFEINNPNSTLEDSIEKSYKFLTDHLGISKQKLVVTYFCGGRVLNKEVPENNISKATWEKLGIKKLVGFKNQNFLLSGNEYAKNTSVIQVAGPRDEIFYELDDGRLIEIGTIQYLIREISYNAFKPLRISPSPSVAYGPERLAMCLNNSKSIFDINTIKQLKEIVENKLGEDNYKIGLSQKSIYKIVDHLRAINFLVADGASFTGDQRGVRLKALLSRVVSEAYKLDITDIDFYKDFITKTIEVYKERFPHLINLEDKKNIILDRVESKRTTS